MSRVQEANARLVVVSLRAQSAADDALMEAAEVKAELRDLTAQMQTVNAQLEAVCAHAWDMEEEVGQNAHRIDDLASRLLTAQEDERARIARELHDDIGQQVAILSIDLELLAMSAPDGDDALGTRVRKAWHRTQELIRSVHDLSHRLHPAHLKITGLIPALERLSEELSRRDVVIAFSHHDVPDTLAPEIMLCLFRIVQEGLRNAIAHSGAKEVSVQLAGAPDSVALSIADEGAGFDVDAARDGLGLRSMRERLAPINGALEIYSAPGAGTRLEVMVPLARNLSNDS
jgi:signal transduction histidine kinase